MSILAYLYTGSPGGTLIFNAEDTGSGINVVLLAKEPHSISDLCLCNKSTNLKGRNKKEMEFFLKTKSLLRLF